MQWTPFIAIGGGVIFAALVAAIVFQPHLTVVLLPALALYCFLGLRSDLRRWPFSWRPVWVLPSIFALYVTLSSLWATDRRAALAAGVLFMLFLMSTRLTFVAIMNAETSVIDRLGKYFVAAVAAGALLLAITIYSHGALHKAICAVFPALAPTDRDWVRFDGTTLEFVGLPYFNRNVALLNLLLWPALLVLARRVVDLRTAIAPLGLFLLVGLTTFGSEHQTSMVALAASSFIFLVYRLSPRTAQILIVVGWVAALLLVRPAVLFAYDHDLHKASWMQESARARIILWDYTIRQMPKAPILGVGAQTTRAESEAGRHAEILPGHAFPQWTGQHGHNIYVQTWYELGVVGAALLLGIGLLILSWLWQIARPSQDFAGAAFVCVSVMCASSFGMWQAWFMAACMIVVAMAALAVRWYDCHAPSRTTPEPVLVPQSAAT
jgi:O-antigen ligase